MTSTGETTRDLISADSSFADFEVNPSDTEYDSPSCLCGRLCLWVTLSLKNIHHRDEKSLGHRVAFRASLRDERKVTQFHIALVKELDRFDGARFWKHSAPDGA